MLKVENLSAGYGKLQVLFNVSFEAKSNKITVIVGPNGSGKSTLLKTLFGLTNIYEGNVEFCGRDITRFPPHKRALMGLAYLPQLGNVFSKLTVRENLMMATYGLPEDEAKDRVEEALSIFPILKFYMNKKAALLSGGERQMLAIAISLIRNPKLIMLDEPTAALAPKIAYQVLNSITRLRDDFKKTIILVEQNAKAALEIGDDAVLMTSGRVIFRGSAQDLLNDKELGSMYLGLTGGS